MYPINNVNNGGFSSRTIPPRLYDNVNTNNFNGETFADLYVLNDFDIRKIINKAYDKRDKIDPCNSREMFKNNKSGEQW